MAARDSQKRHASGLGEAEEAKDGVPVLKPMTGEGLRPEGQSEQEAE